MKRKYIIVVLQRFYYTRSAGLRGLLVIAPVIGLLTACGKPSSDPVSAVTPPAFVGSASCGNCHADQYDQWLGSHHQLAMQEASAESVLGDFDDATFEYFGTHSRFYKEGENYFVATENSSGEVEPFRISDTFGVGPLQQYLVEVDGGRKQALTIVWDSRPMESGGQRWYHLYPDEYIAPDDPLHWTGPYLNWNYMCAECHSTDLKLGYDIDADTFNTTYEEISVGCEACHGPGSHHIALAQSGGLGNDTGLVSRLDDRKGARWVIDTSTGMAERTGPAIRQQQPETCGRCHSRRSVLAPEYEFDKPLADTHMLTLLEEPLYYSDGRINGEVYVYGSFVQSRMYAAGVTCSDCHNPHSGKLKTGPEPNNVCAQCHLPEVFASDGHGGAEAGNCVDCHMPATTYMGIDERRDHSFRVPDAGKKESHYGVAIAAARDAPANPLLTAAISNPAHPAIARATMLTLMSSPATDDEAKVIVENLDDPDSLVRVAALRALRQQPAELRTQNGSHLLRDPVRAVRAEAAVTYAGFVDLLSAADARAFPRASQEYREAMLTAANTPLAAMNLAEFESTTGNTAAAGKYYEHALRLDGEFAAARHAYGLFLVRSGASGEALLQLQKAVELEPDNERFVYVLGVALNSLGRGDEALSVLYSARDHFPESFDIAWALATMLRDSGDTHAALQVAQDMNDRFPETAGVLALIESLRR